MTTHIENKHRLTGSFFIGYIFGPLIAVATGGLALITTEWEYNGFVWGTLASGVALTVAAIAAHRTCVEWDSIYGLDEDEK